MQTIAIRSGRDGRPSLVQRRHDLSGVDYEHIVTIEDGLAQALDDRGVCVWSEDVARAQGRPAVVLHAVPGGKARLEVRADGVDPTTVQVPHGVAEHQARRSRRTILQQVLLLLLTVSITLVVLRRCWHLPC
jgi:hypothetical protein